jgi:hypothetical protein
VEESERAERDIVEALRGTREHADELRARIGRLADRIATSETGVAEAYERCARIRPHAADRLQEAARRAREFAEKERRQGQRLQEEQARETEEP